MKVKHIVKKVRAMLHCLRNLKQENKYSVCSKKQLDYISQLHCRFHILEAGRGGEGAYRIYSYFWE